ncbi:hypothetical protein CIPAW_16G087000 [Carya illinoinensis]|uniref:Uncharacterized protein n=1 Tax=Carya illinoinensis TaxID=32201 RepID=A0A8T1N783_CARIL|nr:hypothetical protein CIPAW_16G087000 [Carya illinoinensis]
MHKGVVTYQEKLDQITVSSTQHEAPQTQVSWLHAQGNQVWTHAPEFFSTPSIAHPPPVQAQPMRLNLSNQDYLY